MFFSSNTILPDIEAKVYAPENGFVHATTQTVWKKVKMEKIGDKHWLKRKYEMHCTPNGKYYTGAEKPFCQNIINKWQVSNILKGLICQKILK